MAPIISSPEEEEEEVEEALPGGRVPVPSSVTKDLLRATVSRSSRAGTSLTPVSKRMAAMDNRESGRRTDVATLRERSIKSPSRSRPNPKASSSSEPARAQRASTGGRGNLLDTLFLDDSDSDDSFVIEAVEPVPRAGPSRSTHGPRTEVSVPLFLDARTVSSSSSRHHSSPVRIARYKDAPYVEIPYIPLAILKRYDKPTKCRHPTTLSRNHQIQFNQTPPPSSPDSDNSIEDIEPTRPLRHTRRNSPRKGPRWKTRTHSISSSDLGGYGSELSSEDDLDEDSEDSDLRPRRTTRSKGKQVATRRSGRAHKQVSVRRKAERCI